MGVVQQDGQLNQWAASLIKKKARSLVGKNGFTDSDQEDIQQELWLHLLRRQNRYDPGRGKEITFIAWVIDNRIRTIIEHRKAGKRSCDAAVQSLDDQVGPQTDMERHEVIDRETYLQATGQISRPQAELQDLKLDVASAISFLPPGLRTTCFLLMRYTITEASRRTGIPRTTLNDRRCQIRRIFEERGLGKI